MPRRSRLTPAERLGLLAFPVTDDELIRLYTFSEPDLSFIRQRRGDHNRLGFAVQLCYLRYPGFILPSDLEPSGPVLAIVGKQLSNSVNSQNYLFSRNSMEPWKICRYRPPFRIRPLRLFVPPSMGW